MSEHDELVERVAKAIAKACGFLLTRHQRLTLARAALDALADDLRHDPPKLKDRIARALWEASHPPANEAAWATITGVLRQVYEDRAEALLAALVHHGVPAPEGCEWVALPTGTVDWWTEQDFSGHVPPAYVTTVDACRDAVARRPKPERRTEWVPWWEAVGWSLVGHTNQITKVEYDGDSVVAWVADSPWRLVLAPDGKVEVLAEDDQ